MLTIILGSTGQKQESLRSCVRRVHTQGLIYQKDGRTQHLSFSKQTSNLVLLCADIFLSRFLYIAIVCLDANFRLKNQLRSSYAKDPGLGTGWAYFVPREEYIKHVLKFASDEDVSIMLYLNHTALVDTHHRRSVLA